MNTSWQRIPQRITDILGDVVDDTGDTNSNLPSLRLLVTRRCRPRLHEPPLLPGIFLVPLVPFPTAIDQRMKGTENM
jgi:hypothetical protein